MKSKLGLGIACIVLAVGGVRCEGQQSAGTTISVSTATYGSNCDKAVPGNATSVAKSECDGKQTCSFPVQDAAGTIGDQCVGLEKTFDATYLCGSIEKTVHVPGPSEKKTALFSCAEN